MTGTEPPSRRPGGARRLVHLKRAAVRSTVGVFVGAVALVTVSATVPLHDLGPAVCVAILTAAATLANLFGSTTLVRRTVRAVRRIAQLLGWFA